MVIHCAKSFPWSTKTWGLPSQLSEIPNVQSKQERVGMNEAGPIMDLLAVCEDAIRTAVQKHSFSQKIQKFIG